MIDFVFFVLNGILSFAVWVIIISAILSWLVAFNVINTRNPGVYRFMEMLDRLTYPILEPFRRVIPNLGGIDISPIIAILIIQGMQRFLLPMARASLYGLTGM
ncbi:YggT family protein [Asticcacaulis sp. DW145]|jgi:YggT family protein|uniref:YggT family protein n=1 Tax=Asticcacaulis currens TaxID=2984210 RepID=A0ABT5ICX7_9CAUL|nr:YggT family protein [Asticcacaulis currens]MDC7694041.1 YggT family protein [Asticcacaulis currens]BEV10012.1 YggT family protein [Asticcacaulis sp. DW145]